MTMTSVGEIVSNQPKSKSFGKQEQQQKNLTKEKKDLNSSQQSLSF